MVSDPFESAYFTLRRSHRHSQEFNALAKEFMESESYTSRVDFNAETGLHELKVKLVRDFPEDLRGSGSDAIKNIRDALDQAMSAATFVLTGQRKRHAHFPFGESADDLENSLSRRKNRNCRDIPEDLFPAIRYIQPYPHEADQWALKTLQKVTGPHKHGVALTLGCAPPMPFSMIELIGEDDKALVTMNFLEWDSSEGEAVVATYGGVDGAMQLGVPFHIAFDHPELKNMPAGDMIYRWGHRTEWVINGLKKTVEELTAKRSA